MRAWQGVLIPGSVPFVPEGPACLALPFKLLNALPWYLDPGCIPAFLQRPPPAPCLMVG